MNSGDTLAEERSKRQHMQNEQIQLRTKIQEREKDIAILESSMSSVKSESMTTDERFDKLNKIYEVYLHVRYGG